MQTRARIPLPSLPPHCSLLPRPALVETICESSEDLNCLRSSSCRSRETQQQSMTTAMQCDAQCQLWSSSKVFIVRVTNKYAPMASKHMVTRVEVEHSFMMTRASFLGAVVETKKSCIARPLVAPCMHVYVPAFQHFQCIYQHLLWDILWYQ